MPSELSQSVLVNPLKLPCGLELKNRIVKSATTEGLADEKNQPTKELNRLYSRWSEGGAGLLITGNIQVDRFYLERGRNVVLEGLQDEEQLKKLAEWAASGKKMGTKFFAQLSHAGLQTDKRINIYLTGPSELKGGSKNAVLTVEEIKTIQSRFVDAAIACLEAGFDGIQILAAHGFLISSFLSPLKNRRSDEYGGSIKCRAKLLLDIIKEIRQKTGPSFAISVKVNSADFQEGGLEFEESCLIVKMLDEASVDVIEISGGNYESPAFQLTLSGEKPVGASEEYGSNRSELENEAYFLEFSEMAKVGVKRAFLMVTGGFRTRKGMESAIKNKSCHLIGVARPLCGMPDAPLKLLKGEIDELPRYEEIHGLPWWLFPFYPFHLYKVLKFFAQQCHMYRCIFAMGEEDYKQEPFYENIYYVVTYDTEENQRCRDLYLMESIGTIVNAKGEE